MFTFRSLGRWMALAVLIGLLGPVGRVQAKKAVITMKDGRLIEGQVVEEAVGSITINIQGIQTTLPTKDIANMRFELTLVDEYNQRKAAIKAGDTGQWYSLARWLYGKNSPEADLLARKELKALIEQHPDDQNARLLLSLTERRISQRTDAATSSGATSTTPENNGRHLTATSAKDWPMLNVKQIRLLKVYEVDLSTQPNVIVPDSTIKAFFKSYRTQKVLEPYQGTMGLRKFKSLSGDQKLALLFEARARKLYDQVLIRDEPKALKTFRSQINPKYVVSYCGACHGKPTISRFYVFTKRANSEPSAYSNYLILNNYATAQGRLIDYAKPSSSLLIQYGLPTHEATTAHPKVPGYRPYFTGLKDRRIDMLTNWIVKDLNRVTPPSYPIEYTIPRKGPLAEDQKPPAVPPATTPQTPAKPSSAQPTTANQPAKG